MLFGQKKLDRRSKWANTRASWQAPDWYDPGRRIQCVVFSSGLSGHRQRLVMLVIILQLSGGFRLVVGFAGGGGDGGGGGGW